MNAEDFAIRIKELRANKHVTQSDVAEATGIPRSTIAHYELGKRLPDYESIVALCSYYSVSADYLIDPFPRSGENSFATSCKKESSPATTRLMNTVRGMEEKDIDTLADIAEVLKRHR